MKNFSLANVHNTINQDIEHMRYEINHLIDFIEYQNERIATLEKQLKSKAKEGGA